MDSVSIENQIITIGKELGFDAVATIPCTSLTSIHSFDVWISEKRHGGMGYMANHRHLRDNPAQLESWVKSAVVCLTRYPAPIDLLPGGLRVARYAQGDDYHEALRAKSQSFAEKISQIAPHQSRVAVDTAPILERSLAQEAGLGWIGKNAMLINQQIGSFTFITELLTDLELERSEPEHAERCGTCSSCIDQCPTSAIIAPRVVDARRCIAYWTIEHRGPIPREIRPLIGDFWFGCDLCQDVCPWNGTPSEEENAFSTRAHYEQISPTDILEMPLSSYTEWFRGSAIKRATYLGLLRNAAIVLGNTRTGFDVLERQLKSQPDAMVRTHIVWAIAQFDTDAARTLLREHQDIDTVVSEEIRLCLGAL